MVDKCKFCGGEIQLINKTYHLVECLNCFLIFSRKKYSQNELKAVYNHLYNDDNPKYSTYSIFEYEQLKNGITNIGYNRERLIKNYINNNSKILEIGSGIGLIGCYIQKNYPNSPYTGVEIDEKINDKAKLFGLNVQLGDFGVIGDFENKFDIVLMWEVLEHIQDLKKCLSLISNRLTKGGLFIFSVPNYDKKFNYKFSGDKIFQDGPPIHLNFFRRKSIEKLFESDDFEILSFRKKKFPYFNFKSYKQMFLRIFLGKYEGSTLFCVLRKK